MLPIVDKMMEGILRSSICSICSFMILLSFKTTRTTTFAPFVFLLLLCRVGISDFPDSQLAKLQERLSRTVDDQQLLSVYFFAKKH